MRLSIIVAVSENGVIGRDNDLPWKLPDDLKFFRKTTSGFPIIMGRKNYESIGRPLPNRHNIVISRDPHLKIEGCDCVTSLDDAIVLAQADGTEEAFVIGGGQIYAQALSKADRLYVTRVHAEIKGDVTFPAIESKEWNLVHEEHHPADENHAHAFTFRTYDRIGTPLR